MVYGIIVFFKSHGRWSKLLTVNSSPVSGHTKYQEPYYIRIQETDHTLDNLHIYIYI